MKAVIASIQRSVPLVWCSSCQKMQPIDELWTNPPPAPDWHHALESLRGELIENRRTIRDSAQRHSTRLRALMSQVDDRFTRLVETLTSEAKEGPRLFSLLPVEPGFLDKPTWVTRKFRLTLWCEHSRLPLPVLNGQNNQAGVYTLSLPRDWFIKAKPFLVTLMSTLNVVLPVAFSAVKLEFDETIFKTYADELDLAQKSLMAGIQSGKKAVSWATDDESPKQLEVGNFVEARGSVLRELHVFLEKEDPGFGGLQRVRNRRNEFLWFHPRFISEY